MDLKWFFSNQILILYTLFFLTFSSLFGILWAVVLLISIELIENNFEFNINIDEFDQSWESQQKRTTYLRDYSSNQDSQEANTFKFQEMVNNERKPNGELKPSLMTLIKHGSKSYNNIEREKHQPLLAIVKNNLHLRRSAELSNLPKSPLYKNIISDASQRNSSSYGYRSPSINSPRYHVNSGWTHPNNSSFRSPALSPSVTLNRSNIYDQKGIPEVQSPLNGSLEVHGSYFVNKSLLHSNLVEDEQFSLVNSKFNSPKNSATNNNSNLVRRIEKAPLMDETSTEAVISILKEKSKRKRVRSEILEDEQQHTQHNESSRKKIKFDPLDDTLDQLVPPKQRVTQTRKRINGKHVIVTKKRHASIGVQCDNIPNKRQATNVATSMERSKYGLSDEQTDQLMIEAEREESPIPKKRVTQQMQSTSEAEELEQAILNVRKTIAKSKNEVADTKQELSHINNDEIDLQRTPMKQLDSIRELKTQSSALKSLKSPFKKLFHTFPSNLTPGSAEKRRKHPVYFTAKIDVDDIQSHREEYGDRGASLKAFRMDQEEAKQRVHSLLDDEEETSKTNSEGITSQASTQLPKSIPTFKITPTNSSFSSNDQPISTGSIFGFSSQASTAVTTKSAVSTTATTSSDGVKTTPKKVTFAIPSIIPSSGTTSTTSSTGSEGFSFKTPSLPTSGVNVSSTMTGLSFAVPKVANSAVASTSATPALNFNLSTKNTGQQPASSSGFSFGSQPATTTETPSAPPPSFTQATASSASSGGLPPFSFAPKPTVPTTTSTVTPNIFAPAAGTSVNIFGAPASTATVTNSSVFGKPAGTAALPSSSLFNATTPASTSFGVQQPASTSTSSLFGFAAPPTTSSTSQSAPSFNFGSKTTTPATSANTSTSQPSFMTNTNHGGFAFNSSTATSNSGFSFSADIKPAVATTVSSGNLFGASATPTSKSVFGPPSAANNVFSNPPSSQSVFNPAGLSSASASIFGAKPVASSQPSFSFGATNPSTSTAGSTTGFSFGANPSPASTTASSGFSFGQSNTKAPSNNSGSVFGQNPASNTASVFGQPAAVQSQASVFGKPSSAAATPFGQAPSISVFRPPTSTASVFGQANNASTNIFGAPNNNVNSVFGKVSTTSTPFGSTNNQNNKAGSVFGAVNITTATVNPFGAGQQQQNTSGASAGFNFGGNSQPSFNFGESKAASGASNNSVFGAPSTSAKPSFNFGGGGGGGQPSFGAPAPSTPSFGVPQPTFGTPQQQQPFGSVMPSFNSPATPASGFTIGANGNPPQRQGQLRARRRKR